MSVGPALRRNILIALVALATVTVQARPPRSTRATGFLQSVDFCKQTFGIQVEPGAKTIEVSWNERTRFGADGQLASRTVLQSGQVIFLTYRTPLFGPRVARRIEPSPSAATHRSSTTAKPNP